MSLSLGGTAGAHLQSVTPSIPGQDFQSVPICYNARSFDTLLSAFQKEDQMTKLREWVVGATLACLWACGSPEQATIEQFFRAARTNDTATVAAMSAVSPPGEVESWQLVEVSSRSTEPFALPELRVRFEAAEKEREATLEEGKMFRADNEEALAEIIPKLQEDSEFEFRGALGETQEEWLKLVEERKVKERAFQETKRAVDDETKLVTRSVIRQVALEDFNGDVAVTEMLLMLQFPDADEKPYNVTLRKYDLSGPQGDRTEPARWIIVDIQEKAPT